MHGQGWRLILEDRIDIDQITNGLDALEHAGRYNPPPVLAGQENAFKVVYFSGSVRTAHREIEGRADVKSHALAEFEYTLQDDALLDLTDEEIRNQLNITLDDLLEEWRLINANGKLSTTQRVGMEAFAEGKIEALKAPSARDDDGFNWVIFPDRLKPGSSVQLLGLSPAVNGDNSDDNPKNRTLNDVDSDAYAEDENNTAEDELKSIAIDLMKDVRLE